MAAGEKLPDWSSLPRVGHAIEARICCEDPDKSFVPKPGPIDTLAWTPNGEVLSSEIRVESGVVAGNKVTPYYDPMIAKLVAWGKDRAEAIARLDALLGGVEIAPMVTNMPFMRRVLGTPEFSSGAYDTSFAEAFAKRK